MKKISIVILSLFPLFSLTSCSSSNIFSLYSDEEISAYEMGREFVEKEDSIAFSALAFEEQSGKNFVFQLFVVNNNYEEVTFNPNQIYIKYFDESKERISTRNVNNAVDPEIVIDNISDLEEERKNTHEVATGLNIVFSLFDTIVDLSDDEDNDAEEVIENVINFTGIQIGEEISYDNDIEELKQQKEFWVNEPIRKSVLSQEEQAEGLIFVPINKDAKYVKIFIPIGEATHIYKFIQVVEN